MPNRNHKYNEGLHESSLNLDTTFDHVNDEFSKNVNKWVKEFMDVEDDKSENMITMTFADSLRNVLKGIDNEQWAKANIVLSEVAMRFSPQMGNLIQKDFNSIINRIFVHNVLNSVKTQADLCLKKSRLYFESIELYLLSRDCNKAAVFSNETNDDRICSYFRMQLCESYKYFNKHSERLKVGKIIKICRQEALNGIRIEPPSEKEKMTKHLKLSLYKSKANFAVLEEEIKKYKFQIPTAPLQKDVEEEEIKELKMEDNKILMIDQSWIERDLKFLTSRNNESVNKIQQVKNANPLLIDGHVFSKFMKQNVALQSTDFDSSIFEVGDFISKVFESEQKVEIKTEKLINIKEDKIVEDEMKERPKTKRERYLRPLTHRTGKLSNLDFESIELRKIENVPDSPWKESVVEGNVLRLMDSRLSNRQQQESIDLSPSDLIKIDFINDTSGNDVSFSISDLLPESAMDSLLTLEEDEENQICSPILKENISDYSMRFFKGERFVPEDQIRKLKDRKDQGEERNKDRNNEEIKGNESKNKLKNIKIKTPKTGTLEIEDYFKYLQLHSNDFLDSLILDRFLVDMAEETKELLKMQKQQKDYELEKKIREEEERKRKERISEMLHFEKGKWNSKIIDYFDEIKSKRFPKVFLILSSPFSIQERLERIWQVLELEDCERISLAIKFGNHDFDGNKYLHLIIVNALKCLEEIVSLIIKREALMNDIKEFEVEGSNPRYFNL
ncbi:hypothetical protein O9G_002286 [Rozella allomycis CSF55]|uniref:Uncharacterized protein n=1 Tax=Rozella allomycis (strain CSF55) TaxID=988480 RepID=A0A075AQQ7_ROZAC|nr:hypothetical protein O9G_002286 [Rozella allomycis CSF55]|eukprot:EPZ32510.1 hypothetical protein O9G_002286 [Rozella allomycis CSF55]